MIPHARGLAAALAARSLAIAVIETALGAVAMATARAAQAVAAGEARAVLPTVDVAPVAGAADHEQPLAARAPGQAARRGLFHRLPQDGRRHDPSECAENVRQSEAGECLP